MSKISDLPSGGSLQATDYLIAVRSGSNVKVQPDSINFSQVDLADSAVLQFGDSQDLTIVHNTFNSVINQAGTGNLLIQKAGSTKLTINASGIDVTGSVTADGPIVLTAGALAAAGNAGLSHRSTDNKVYLQAGTGGFNILDDQQNTYFAMDSAGASTFYGSVTADGLAVDTAAPFMSFKESGATKLFIGESSAVGGGAGYYDFYAVTGLGQRFFTNSLERLRIDGATGNVGIGATSPSSKLEIYGSNQDHLRLTQSNTDINYIIGPNGSGHLAISSTGTGAGGDLFIIQKDGSVGIGTSTPSSALDVVGSVTASNALVITGGITGHGANRATFSQEGANGAFIQSYGANTSTMGAFSFRQASSDFSITATPLTISATGNVGIGTSNPSSFYTGGRQLVVGSGSGEQGITVYGGNTNTSYLLFADGTSGAELYAGQVNYNHANNSLNFNTNGITTPHMTIDASGRVGIGGVPNTNWRNDLVNQEVLMIGTEATLFSDGGVTTELWNNAYIDNTDVIFNISTRAASRYQQYQGAHKWWTAASVPAGSNINTALGTTPKMTLDVSGNLTINDGVIAANSTVASNGNNHIFTVTKTATASSLLVSAVSLQGYSTAATAMQVGNAGGTGRSINAGGTVNASGADYAEYERNGGLSIAKGDIVGFKADGVLTLTFSEAIRFAVKSTDPSYVGGDTWGGEDQVGVQPQAPAEDAEQEVIDQYETDIAAFNAAHEAARQLVDRIAYSGKVPVNIQGATAGDYIIAVAADDGSIDGQAVADPDFTQYKLAVGRVNRTLDDGRAEIAVIIH